MHLTDAELVDQLGVEMTATLKARAREMLATARCPGCGWRRPLRVWPLKEGTMLCDTCWTRRVRGEIVVHWSRHGTAHVATTHPQYGTLWRGTIRVQGVEPHELRPAPVWRITDADHEDLGTYAGDYVDAERRLLDATAGLDEIDPDYNPTDDEE